MIIAMVGFAGSSYKTYDYMGTSLWNESKNWFSRGEYLIGDKAYPLSRNMITPYKHPRDGTLTPEQLACNRYVTSQGNHVARTFGMLKQRFKILQDGFQIRMSKNIEKREERDERINRIGFLLCGLHNMLKDFEDDWAFELDPSELLSDEDEDEDDYETDENEYEYEEPVVNPDQFHLGDLPLPTP